MIYRQSIYQGISSRAGPNGCCVKPVFKTTLGTRYVGQFEDVSGGNPGRKLARQSWQLERPGYFTLDADSKSGKLVLNRTATLKDAWAKEAKK